MKFQGLLFDGIRYARKYFSTNLNNFIDSLGYMTQ